MTFQPYPTGGGSNQMAPTADRPPQPWTVRIAVRLMLAGAALDLLSVIVSLALSSRIKSAVTKAALKANATNRAAGKPVLSTSDIHNLANATVTVLAVGGVIALLLWLWMAWANNKGSGWARIVATVLFALNTISLVLEAGRASLTIIVAIIGWLVGLTVIVLLWRRETSNYIRPRIP